MGEIHCPGRQQGKGETSGPPNNARKTYGKGRGVWRTAGKIKTSRRNLFTADQPSARKNYEDKGSCGKKTRSVRKGICDEGLRSGLKTTRKRKCYSSPKRKVFEPVGGKVVST